MKPIFYHDDGCGYCSINEIAGDIELSANEYANSYGALVVLPKEQLAHLTFKLLLYFREPENHAAIESVYPQYAEKFVTQAPVETGVTFPVVRDNMRVHEIPGNRHIPQAVSTPVESRAS